MQQRPSLFKSSLTVDKAPLGTQVGQQGLKIVR